MVKRQLDKQEDEMTNKGIIRIENQINELNEQIVFNEKVIAFQKIQEEYQNSVRPYLEKKKEEENKKIMGTLNEQLARLNDTLKLLKNQKQSGVIVK
jgi:hypothetical protein